MGDRPTVFISYSRADEMWKDRLVKHLGVLERQGLLDVWDANQIGLGLNWEAEITRAIERATVAVLLLSVDYLNSDFVLQAEIPRILLRRAHDGMRVIPVVVRPCPWSTIEWLQGTKVFPEGEAISAGKRHKIELNLTLLAEEIYRIIVRKTVTAPNLPNVASAQSPWERHSPIKAEQLRIRYRMVIAIVAITTTTTLAVTRLNINKTEAIVAIVLAALGTAVVFVQSVRRTRHLDVAAAGAAIGSGIAAATSAIGSSGAVTVATGSIASVIKYAILWVLASAAAGACLGTGLGEAIVDIMRLVAPTFEQEASSGEIETLELPALAALQTIDACFDVPEPPEPLSGADPSEVSNEQSTWKPVPAQSIADSPESSSKQPAVTSPPAKFNFAGAVGVLSRAAKAAKTCRNPTGPAGRVTIRVTFESSGKVSSAQISEAPALQVFSDTPVGKCIEKFFREITVEPFTGSAVTTSKSFYIGKPLLSAPMDNPAQICVKQKGERCAHHDECCSTYCVDGYCHACQGEGDSCASQYDCCGTTKCIGGRCKLRQ